MREREREEKEVSLEETREMTCEMIREYAMCKLLSRGEPERGKMLAIKQGERRTAERYTRK